MIRTTSDRTGSLPKAGLGQRVVELEQEIRRLTQSEHDKAELEHSLRERIKELNCLYGIAQLVENTGDSIDELLQGTVELLPPSWQYPVITCARIRFESQDYLTDNFKPSTWQQSATITVAAKEVGTIEVFYLEKMPQLDEGPFLKEERWLINAIGERLGRIAERIQTRRQLEVEQTALKDMNTALREVLASVQDEKKDVGRRIQANIDNVVIPILHTLENEVSSDKLGYVTLLKHNLEDIVSPFVNRLSQACMSLTPAEIQICYMIRDGLSSKEIAQLRHLSPITVSRHREHIRQKLGLKNRAVNLASYLQNFMSKSMTRV
jgi:DNA-binding CsgD family transcriptional regulator